MAASMACRDALGVLGVNAAQEVAPLVVRPEFGLADDLLILRRAFEARACRLPRPTPQAGNALGVGEALPVPVDLFDHPACPQRIAHAVGEERRVDRLGDEIRRPGIVGPFDGSGVVQSRKHDHRNADRFGALAQRAANLVAVHPRHHHIEQHQVRAALLDLREPARSVVGFADLES